MPSKRSTQLDLTRWTDAQLQKAWETGFENRVKSGSSKGQIKLKTIHFCDEVLREAELRGLRLITPAEYQ